MQRFLIGGVCAALIAGCAGNPYTTGEHQNTARGATIGAAGGAVLGNVIAGEGRRTEGALVGAAVGALAGGLIGRQMDQQEAELRRQMENTGVGVERQGESIRLRAPEAITFDTGKAVIRPGFRHVLDDLAYSLRQYPNTTIQIEGHTDSVGSAESNQRLSENRAQSVRSYLIQAGVPASRLVAIGYGKSRPIA
ncbi:MAG: OmpA family protein, partial [Halothiobacillaceae bacterium]|nr:OmpA family protein [Halothiobacillaceae bacterium]